jgi:glycosyltransferase involved in cell wall biosynthesis
MKSILIIGFVWPEPNSTAAGSRMLQLIEIFKQDNYTITFVSTASKTTNSFNLESLGIQTLSIKLNDRSFDKLLTEINPSIVLFDRYLTEEQFGWRVEENCPNAIRILDTEDLHFLRNARQVAFKNKTDIANEYLTSDITKREIASIYRCDLTLIISKYEVELLINKFHINSSLLLYIPFLLNKIDKNVFNSYPAFQERNHFMTIGNFKHEPNYNAVLQLKKQIWPLIKAVLPEAELHIYGAYTSQKVQQLQNIKEGFYIKGWILNAEDAFKKARVCLAPIQFGAGLKGKLIESMVYGTPSVTTTVGSEGMHEILPWNGFIENNYENFSKKAIELYLNEETWLISQQNGIKIINECFVKEKYSNLFLLEIEKLKNQLFEHRKRNFIGSMLNYHTIKSSKYLSKWIEEKNKQN